MRDIDALWRSYEEMDRVQREAAQNYIEDRDEFGQEMPSGEPHTTDHRTTGQEGQLASRLSSFGSDRERDFYTRNPGYTPQIISARGYAGHLTAHMASRPLDRIVPRADINEATGVPMANYYFQGTGQNLHYVNTSTGEAVLNRSQIQQAFSVSQSAIQKSLTGTHGMSDENTMGTVIKNVNKEIAKHFKEQIRNAASSTERDMAKLMESAAKEITNALVESAYKTVTGGDSTAGVAATRSSVFNTTIDLNRLPSLDTAQQYVSTLPPQTQAAIAQAGGLQALAQSPTARWFSGGDGMGISVGGGGSGWAGGGGRQGSIWGVPGGQLMHAMYVGQRMWGYSGGKVMQAAEQYAQGLSQWSGLYRQTIGDPMGSQYGAAARRQIGADWFGQGAFESFGAVGDIGYLLAGADETGGVARLAAGAGVGVGAAATLSLASIAPALGFLGPAAVPVGAAIMGGVAVNEAINLATGTDLGFGERIMRGISGAGGRRATIDAYRDTGFTGFISRDMMQNPEQYGLSDDAIRAQMSNANLATLYLGRDESKAFDQYRGAIKDAAVETGGDKKKAISMAGAYAKYVGSPDAMMASVQELSKMDLPIEESLADVLTMASQGGVMPGDQAQIMKIMGEYASSDAVQQLQMKERYSQYAQVGSMLGTYMGSQMQGAALAREYNLSMNAGRVAQQYMAVTTKYGGDLNRITSYEISKLEAGQPAAITTADMIAMRAKQRTPFQASIDVAVGDIFMQAGESADNALVRAEYHGFERESQVGTFQTWMKSAESFRGGMATYEIGQLANASLMQNAAQGQMIAGVSGRMQIGGMDPFTSLSGLGLTDQTMQNVTAAIGGDFQAASFLTRQGVTGLESMNFFDAAARPQFLYNGGAAWDLAVAQQGEGNPYAAQFMEAVGNLDPELQGIFEKEGYTGLQDYYRGEQRNLQRAALGVGYARIAEQQSYLWGQSQGGTWDDPTRGSLWGIQDVRRQIQHESTLAGFESQRQRMDINTAFAISSEGIQERQMNLTQGFQSWQLGFNRQSALNQRGYTVQGWAAQDQMTDLQFGWQMEDMDEAIRMSGGRERRQLVTQKERATLMRNLTEQRKEDVRENQEEVWAREDERYEQQREYQEELQKLDQERFELQINRRQEITELDEADFERKKEEYEELYELNEEQVQLQREHQKKMIDFQLQSLGIQSAQLALQEEMEEQLQPLEEGWGAMTGWAEIWKTYDVEAFMKPIDDMLTDLRDTGEAAMSIEDMAESITGIDQAGLNVLNSVLINAGHLDTPGLRVVDSVLTKLNNINTFRINILMQLLDLF